jgi:hypothetical protein
MGDVFEGAKEIILTRGWRQGTLGGGSSKERVERPTCVGLAIIDAASDRGRDHYPYMDAFIAANGIEGPDLRSATIFAWNDAPGRTRAEVLAALDKAIEVSS